jgi:hypothetical protein
VIWVDAGDELLVHLDSIRVRLLDRIIAVSIDLECDQTGRTPLICVFATGAADDPAGLFCATDELPRGNVLLAARWGDVVQSAVWASLLGLVQDHAAERHLVPVGLAASAGALRLQTAQSVEAIPVKGRGGTPR